MNDDRFPVRKNPRLKIYDYTTPNYYFVTICTKDKKCIFGTADQLNCHGRIAYLGLQEMSHHFPGVQLEKFVVMPNHIHAIIVLQDKTVDLSTVVGQYKSFVSKNIHAISPELKVWQTSFHDHVIRDQRSYEKIWNYIDTNPLRWNEDCFYSE
jgi:REP element-mobilizing transposase RayT